MRNKEPGSQLHIVHLPDEKGGLSLRRDNAACFLGLPVSTTHTTVGAVVGMALVLQGSSAVQWHASSSAFPFYKGALLPVSLRPQKLTIFQFTPAQIMAGVLCVQA